MGINFEAPVSLMVSTLGTTITIHDRIIIERSRSIYPSDRKVTTSIRGRYEVESVPLCEESQALYDEIQTMLGGFCILAHRAPGNILGMQRWINDIVLQSTNVRSDGTATVSWSLKSMSADEMDEVQDFVATVVREYDMAADTAMVTSMVSKAVDLAEQILSIEMGRQS